MKRVSFIFIIASFILSWTGCASSGKAIVEQKDPIALVSVVSNREINWKGEDSASSNSVTIFSNRTLQNDPDMTLVSYADDLINIAETLFRDAVNASPLINLADRDAVLSSRAYREARTNEPTRNALVKPDGYRFVYFRDKNLPVAFASETGIGRIMFVEFNFNKAMYSGLGKTLGDIRAELDMNILILDSNGKTLYNKVYTSWSRSTIKVSSSAYSQSGLMELFEEAIADVCVQMLDSF